MAKTGVTVMGLAAAACLLVAGCSPRSCGPGKCPLATFGVRALDDSSVTWSSNGGSAQTTTGFAAASYPPSGTDCLFSFSTGQIFRAVGDAGADRLLKGYFDVTCGGGAVGGFDFLFWQLGDFRDLSAGTFTMVPPTGSFGMDYFGPSSANSCMGIAVDMEGIVMTVTVETATGSGAPYPQLVTGDFVRTLRLDFDTSTATSTRSGGEPCDFPLAVQASLHLTQTAADYVYNADAPCQCE